MFGGIIMIVFNEKGKLELERLLVQNTLSAETIKKYDHRKIMSKVRRIFKIMDDSYYYQINEDKISYEITDDLKFIVHGNIPLNNIEAIDIPLTFNEKEYRNSQVLYFYLLKRFKEAFSNLDEVERFIIKNFEYDKPQIYVDESICYEMNIHKDKYYLSKKSAYIKLAIQLGLTYKDDIDELIITKVKETILEEIVTLDKNHME